jgi:hypothetical protein
MPMRRLAPLEKSCRNRRRGTQHYGWSRRATPPPAHRCTAETDQQSERPLRGQVQQSQRMPEYHVCQTYGSRTNCAGSPSCALAFEDFRAVNDNLHGGTRVVPYCVPRPERGQRQRDRSTAGWRCLLARIPMAALLQTRTLSQSRGPRHSL